MSNTGKANKSQKLFGAALCNHSAALSIKVMEGRHILRGDIYYADLHPAIGSEQDGIRPVLIIQNNIGNRYSPTVIVAAITSSQKKKHLPTHIPVGNVPGMFPNSIILLEQIRTLDKCRLLDYVGALQPDTMKAVDQAINISVGQD